MVSGNILARAQGAWYWKGEIQYHMIEIDLHYLVYMYINIL